MVVEYHSPDALCAQLKVLLQGSVQPVHVFVDATFAQHANVGVIRGIIDSLGGENRVSLITASSGDGSESVLPSRRRRFQWALQATTRHVLVMDANFLPGSRLLEYLSAADAIPGVRGVLGVAGWRLLRSRDLDIVDASQEKIKEEASDAAVSAMGDVSLSFPDEAASLRVGRLSPADCLRSAWFVRTEWIPLLLRDIGNASSSLNDEATISALFWKHGGLPSLVIPQVENESSTRGELDCLVGREVDPPTEGQVRDWRIQLREFTLLGMRPQSWRTTYSQSQSLDSFTRATINDGNRRGSNHKNEASELMRSPVLLIIPSLEVAFMYEMLFKALLSPNSLYDPRIVYSVDSHCSDDDHLCDACNHLAYQMNLTKEQHDRLCYSSDPTLTILRGDSFWKSAHSSAGLSNLRSGGSSNLRSRGGLLASMQTEMDDVLRSAQPTRRL